MTIPDTLTEADFNKPGGHKQAILDKLEEHREYMLHLDDLLKSVQEGREEFENDVATRLGLMATALSKTLTSGHSEQIQRQYPTTNYPSSKEDPVTFDRSKGMYKIKYDKWAVRV